MRERRHGREALPREMPLRECDELPDFLFSGRLGLESAWSARPRPSVLLAFLLPVILAGPVSPAAAQGPSAAFVGGGEVRNFEGETAEFVVEREGDTSQELVVFYEVSAADGGGGSLYREGTTSEDIEEKTGTLTFAADSRRRQTISVEIKDDDVYEPWERYVVTLSFTDGGPAVDTAYGRITENDPRNLTFATGIRVKEGMPQQALKVELDEPLPYDLSVEYEVVDSRHLTSTETTGDGGATMADHELVDSEGICNPNVKIPKGSRSGAIDIPIVDDQVPEPDEQFRLRVSTCQHATPDGAWYPLVRGRETVTVTIEDDDDPEENRYVYLQGGGGSGSPMRTQVWVDEGKSVPVTATLVGVAPTTDVRIPLKFTGFPSAEVTTADYTIPGFITIQAGKKSGSVTLAVRDDSTDERHRELLAIEINDGHDDWPSGYVKGDRSRFEVIMKDVQGLGVQLRSLGKSSLSEGAADKKVTFEIHMDRLPKGGPTGTAPFSDIELEEGQAPEFALSYGGGAARGADYESVNSVSAGTGNTDCQRGTGITCTVTLTVKDDDLYEHDEKVTIALNPGGSKIENGGGFTKKGSDLSLTIEDNDVQPMFSIEDVEVREGGSAGFKVKRASGAKENSISVQAATARDGRMGQTPATAGSDYGAKSGTLTLGRNVTQATFTVATTDDMLDEPDETFQVSLSNPRDTQGNPAPGISDGEAIGTIEDGDDPPSFSIAGGEADEGEDVVFTVTRSGATGNAATVKVATAADTDDDANPAAAADYEAISPARTLSFPGGTTSVTVEVEAKDDDLYEPDDETFLAVISGAALADGDPGTGVGIAADGGSAKGTIMDTDEQPSFSVAAASAMEGAAVTFTVTRSGASGNAVSVHWKTKADAGEGVNSASSADYTAVTTAQRLDFAAGITAVTFTVATTGDALDEPDETFRVELTAAGGGARIATAEAIGTITDDDDPPTVSVGGAAAVAEGDDSSKTTAMTFTVRLSAASGRTVTVPYTLGGTATAPADYTAPVSLTVTIAPGGTSATIAIPVKGDVLDEPDETVTVTLGAPTHATVSTAEDAGTGSGTITDDDATPSFSIADASGSEGDAITFTATRSGAVDNVVSVQWTTAADSGQGVVAAGAGDYTAVSTARTLDFAAGVTARTLTVATTEDTLDEPAETFRVVLSRPAKGASDPGGTPTITAGTAVGTIIDDDDPPTASVGDAAAVAEGDDSSKTTAMTFTVSLSAASGRTVTVPYTLGGTASSPADYAAPASRTVTIAPGDTSAAIAIPVKGDALDEPDETVTVTLGAPTHATVSTAEDAGTGSGTITDDDAPAVLSIRSTFGDEGDSGTTNLTFVVTLAPVSGQTVTVKYADAGSGSATPGAGGDYAALSSGTISFSPGETRKRIRVKVNGDTDYEPEETVIVRLSGASNATLSGGESTLDGIGYIENDDAPPLPRIAPGDVTVEEGKTATFTVTRSHDFEPVTVSYGTSPGSATSTHDAATSGTDYVPYSADSTETFAIGEKSIELDFETEDDKLHEAPEDFTVAISGTGYSETFVVTIIDNDPVPTATLALTDSSIREADGRSRVTASLDRPTSRDLRLAVNATPKSDHAGTGDIKRTGQRLTIPAGATASTGIVALTGIDNKVDAPDKVFTVSAILFGNADIDDPADVTLTITDDDDPPTVSVGDAAAVDEGDDSSKTTDMTFTVRLSGASGRTVTVPYTLDGTAAAPADYAAPTSRTVTIAPGDTSASIAIPVKGDEIDEPDETVTVTLGTPTHATLSTAKGAGTGSGTITDDDERGITVAGGPLTLAEADVGSTQDRREDRGTYTVVLSSRPTGTVTVSVASDPATGVVTVSPPRLTFAPSAWSTAQTVTVTAVDDAIDNPGNEREAEIEHTVSALDTDYALETAAAVDVTVTDDDAAPSGITLTAAPDAVAEGAGATAVAVTASVNGATRYATATAVTVSVDDDTAIAPADYAAVADFTLTIAAGAGSASGTFTLTPRDDALDEADETIDVTGSSGALTVTGDEIEITDDDAAPSGITLTAAPDAVAEGAGATAVAVTASVNGATRYATATAVTVSVDDDTAIAPADYAAVADFTLTIAAGAGSASGTFTLTPRDDALDESDETIDVTGSSGALTVTGDEIEITDNDERGITVAGGPLTLAEADVGSTQDRREDRGTYTVVLSSRPTGTVTVSVASDPATGVVTVSPPRLTFAPSAWSTAQTVTVTAVDDAIDNPGNEREAEIEHTVSALDTDYALETAAAVDVTVTDDDAAPSGITLTAAPDAVAEGAGATAVAVTASVNGATRYATATAVTVSVDDDTAIAPADYAAVADFTLTIAAGAGSASGTFTLTPRDDALDESDETIDVTGSSGALTVTGDEIEITDNDERGITVAGGPLTLAEADVGSTQDRREDRGTYTVVLSSRPTGTVTVSVASDPATGVVTVSPPRLTFAPSAWSTAQTVTVTAVDDAIDNPGNEREAEIEHTVSALDTDYALETAAAVDVTVTDDDAAPSGITLTAAPDAVAEGAGATAVAVTASVNGATRYATATAVTVSVDDDTAIAPADYAAVADFTLTIAAGAGSASGTFTLTPRDDALDESDETIDVTGSSGALTVTGDEIEITDNDERGITVAGGPLTLAEADVGSTQDRREDRGTYTVVLSSRPTGTVTVSVASDPATGVVTVSPPRLTFAPSAWSTAQTVTVTAVDDAIDNPGNEREAEIEHTVSALDTDYALETAAAVDVTVTDDDAAPSGITLTAAPDAVAEGAGATAVAVTASVNGATRYATATAVTVSVDDDTAIAPADYAAVADFTLTIAAGAGSASGTFTLTPRDDALDESDETIDVTGSSGALTVTGDEIEITDNDERGITVAGGPLTLAEADVGSTQDRREDRGTYTVVLSSRPTGTVTVSVASDPATGVVTVSPPRLTFAPSAWSTAQTVTVTAVDDAIDNPGNEREAEIEHTVSALDTDYALETAAAVDVTVTDDDAAPSGITLTAAPDAVAEGAGATAVAVTASVNGATRYATATAVTVSVDDDTAIAPADYAAVADFTLTIAAGAGSASGTFTLTPRDDALDESDETIDVTGSSGALTVTGDEIEITDNDERGITVAGGPLTLAEADVGSTQDRREDRGTYTVVLSSRPTGTVTVSVASDPATGVVTVSPPRLTFAPSAWSTAQTVTVTAVDDAIDNPGNEREAEIEHTVSALDTDYALETAAAVDVTVTDDDAAPSGITLTAAPDAVAEGAGATAVAVTASVNGATRYATATAVTVSVDDDTAIAPADYAAVADFTLTIAAGAGSASGTFTLTPRDDALDESDETIDVTGSSGALTVTGDEIEITDNDERGITVAGGPLTLAEADVGSTQDRREDRGTYTVVLSSRPTGTVTVSVASDPATGVVTVSPPRLTFAPSAWSTAQTVTVTAVDDAIDNPGNEREAEIEHTVSALDTDYALETAAAVDVTVTDDDAAPSGITLTAAPDAVAEGAGATAVAVTASVNGATRYATATAVTVSVDDDTAIAPADYAAVADFTLTIAAGAGSASGTFTLTPRDDALDESDETIDVTGSSGALTVTGDEIEITDNDERGITVAGGPLTLAEADVGSTQDRREDRGTYTVVLSSRPTGTVTVSVASDPATGVVTVSPPRLTFAPSAWSTAQTVTVTAVDDAIDNPGNEREAEIEHTVSALDTDYALETAAAVDVTVTDDDAAPSGITLTAAPDAVAEGAGATAVAVTASVNGATRYATATAVTVSVDDDTAIAPADYAAVADFTLTIAAGAGSASGTFTLTPRDDALDESDETIDVTGSSGALTVTGDEIEITDNDERGITVAGGPLTLAEADVGSTQDRREDRGTYTVVLSSRPTGTVTVSVASDPATGVVTVSPPRLTFAPSAWSTAQTVTVTAVDDAIDNPGNEREAEIEHTVSALDTDYALETAAAVDVTVTDDDAAPSGITLTAAPDAVAEGAGATAVAVTASVNGATRYATATAVTVSVDDDTAIAPADYAAVADFTLTIAAGAGSASGTFTLTPRDDALDEADETIDVTGSSGALTVTGDEIEITDNDERGITVAGGPLTLAEADVGSTQDRREDRGTYTVVLSSRPTGTVTVSVASDPATGVVTVSPPRLTFAPSAWSTAQTVTVTAVDDAIDNPGNEREAEIEHTVSALDTDYALETAAAVDVTVTDDDAAPSGITLTAAPDAVAEGAGATAVAVTASVNGATRYATATAVTVSVDDDTAIAPADYAAVADFTLTIAAGAGSASGTFTLTPRDDALDESDETIDVTGSSGALTVTGDEIEITDNDERGITVAGGPLTLAEADVGSTQDRREDRGTYTVVLSSRPTGTVTVSVASDPATGVVTVSPPRLTFAPSAWSTAQTVTVTAVDDAIDNPGNEREAEIEHTVSALDTDYALETAAAVDVTVTDDDAAPSGITLTAAPDAVAEGAGATAVAVTASVNGATRYATATAVTVSVDDDTAIAPADYAAVADFTLTIAAGAGSASGTFTLTPVDDALDESDETIDVTGSSGALTVTGDEIEITDDDAAPGGITLTAAPDAVAEGAGATAVAVTASVNGATRYATATAVTVSVDDDTAIAPADYAAVADFTLTIAAGAGSASGTFTLTPVDDALDESDETIDVTGSSGALTVTGDEIEITDNDERGITVAGGPLTLAEADVGSTQDRREDRGTYTVVLSSRPTGTVTVSVASDPATGVVTVSPPRLTFAPSAWSTAQTVTVTAVDDAIDNPGNEREAEIEHTVSALDTDYALETAAAVDVTVTDDDAAPGGITLTAAPDAVAEGAGATAVAVTASVNGATRYATATAVTVSVDDDTAIAPADYAAVADFTLTIAAGAGSASGTFTLTPRDDALDESDETIDVTGSSGALTVTGDEIEITDDDAAPGGITLTAAPDAVAEGAGATAVAVTASVNGATRYATATAVTVSVDDDTAIAPADYAAVADFTLTIAAGAGSASGTFTLTPRDDALDESDETIDVTGSSGALTVTGDEIEITDDDAAPGGITLTAAPDAVAEGAGATAVAVTASVNGATRYATATAVTVSVDDDTAIAPADYAAVADFTLTIAAGAGSASGTFTLTPRDDALDESDETIDVTGSSGALTVTGDEIEITDNDERGITVAGGPLTLAEADVGSTQDRREDRGTYTVVLSSRPTGTVTVSVASDPATGVVTVSPPRLTFAPSAWSTAQTVTVTAVDDAIDNPGNEREAEIEHTVSALDTDYALETAAAVDVTVTDDDAAPSGITLTAAPDAVAEGAGATAVAVTASVNGATRYATATAVTVSVDDDTAIAPADYAAVADFTLTIAAGAGSASGTFTLTPVDDALDESDETIDVTGSSGALTVTGDEIEITDNDERGITVAGGPLTLAEADVGSTQDRREDRGTYTVVLSSRPTGTVTVSVASDPATGVVTVSPPRLTFAPSAWSTAQTVTVTAVDDAIDNPGNEREAEIEHTVSALDTDYALETAAAVDVTVTDDDAAPSGITLTAAPDAVAEGAGATAVAVTASVNGATRYATATAVTVSVDDDTAIAPADYAAVADFTLTIAAGAGSASGTFTLTPRDDALDESDETIDVTGSSGALTVTGDEIEITDNDERGITVAGGPLTLAEADVGSTQDRREDRGTYTVVLSSRPTGTVTVSVASDPATGVVTVSPPRLTFAPSAWSTAQTVTVTAVDDAIDNPGNEREAEIEHTVSALDTDYALETAAAVDVTVTDDDAAPSGITLTAAPDAVAEGAGATAVAVTASVNGATRYATATAVTVSVDDDTAIAPADYAAVADFTLTIAAGAGSASGTFTLTPRDDALDESDETIDVTGSSGALTVTGDEIEITDDDAAPGGITLTAAPDAVAEGAGATAVAVTASVNGATRYATATAVTVSVDDDTAIAPADYAAVADFTLTIAAGAGSASGTFTLTPRDDALDESDETIDVTGSSGALTVTGDEIEITDDDAAPGGITLTAAPDAVAEGAGATAVAVTASVNGATRYATATAVTVSVDDDTAIAPADYAAVADFTLTIAAGAGSASGTFTLTPVDDALDESDETIDVTGSSGALTVTGDEIEITDNDERGITVAGGPLTLAEADVGSTQDRREDRGTYTVVLSSRPTGTVTVSVASDPATGVVTVSPPRLTFAPSAWSTAQTVTVTAVDDAIDNPGNEREAEIEHTVSALDTDYALETAAAVDVTVTDDDAAPGGITLTAAPDAVAEGAGATAVAVTASVNGATRYATATAVTVSVDDDTAIAPADYAAVADFTLTIAAGAGSASGTFTLTPRDDALDESDETIDVTGSSGALTVTGDEIEITDDDAAPGGITLTAAPDAVAEGVGATAVAVTASVNGATRYATATAVTVSVDDDTAIAPADYAAVADFTLTIAAGAGSASGTFTLTPVDDALDESDETIDVTGSSGALTVTGDEIEITDDDAAPGGITLTAAPDAVAEGAGATAVAVTASVNGATRYATATAVTVSVDDDTAIAPADYAAVADFTLTIAAGAGSASGTFTLTPVDDALDESNETIDVTGSSGALTVTGDEIEITDDDTRTPIQDTPEVSLMLTPTKIDESGSANVSTVTATLDGMSSAAVTVTISIPSDAPVTQSGTTLTIAAGTTSSTGTVTLTAVDDEVDAPDRTVTVSGTASGGGISNPADVTLTIVDDDVRGIVLTPAVVGVAEGSSATYTVKLATEPSASATVAISGHAGTDLTLDSTSLTFAPSAWSTAQTVTVTAAEDVDFTNETATLTHTASGGDYGSVTGAVTVNTTDNDTKPTAMTITVDTDSNQDGAQTSITENAGATTVRITAAIAGAGRFTTDQTVTLAVGHAGDGAVEGVDYATVPALSLTIAAGQASGSVDFTLTPTDDGTDEADEAIGVSGTLSGVTVSAAMITLVDDDATPTVRLALTPSSISEGGGATGGTSAVTATLNRASSETVTLTVAAAAVSPATAGDYTLSANKILTIAAGSLTSTGTVKIVAVDNPVDAPDKQVTVSAAVSGGHGVAPPGPVALTIADDDDPPTALTLSVDTDVGSTAASSAVGEEGGAVTVRVTATLDGATRFSTDRTVTVTVGQAEDSAVEEIDYAAVADLSLTLPAGRASGSADFTLTPTDDDINEPDETISVIGTLSEVTVTPAAITVLDDDAPPVVSLLLTPSRIVENGGPADDTSTVTASLSNPSSTEIALTVSAEPVPPAASGDFTFYGGTLTIAAGSRTSTGTVSIVAVDDHLHSGDRRIAVSATASGNPGVANPAPATLILADDDAAPTLLNLSVDIDPEEAGLQNSLAEDSEAVTVRVVATLEGDIRFAEEKTVTVVVGMTGDSAIEGQDYETVADLSLTLPAGQASASVDFTLAPINDGVNETEEMIGIGGTLAGVSVTPAAIILHNSNDPVPKEWLARFGRTVSEQLLDGIAGRIDEIRKPGFESTLAGSVLSVAGPEGNDETPWDRRQDEAESNWAQGFKAAFGEDPGDLRREEGSATGRDLFDDGAFSYTSEEQGGAVTAFWGRIARSGFDGRGRDYAYDSEVTTGMLGLDWARIGTDENWSGGFVVSRSQGDGGYTGEVGLSGSAESTLTAFAPWLSYQGSDRLAVWGAAGYGEGDFTIAPEGEPAATADLDWAMAAAGVHYQLVRASPERAFALKLKTDALWTRTNMEEAMGLAEAQADVTRFRLGLENSWRIQQEDAGVLTPRFEVGVRHDGGDAETGFSVELGGGLTWVLPARGLDISLEGRSLVLHEDGFHNWGYAASMAFDPDPASARGFSLTLSQSLGGDPSGGVDALFAEGAPAQENASVGEGGWQAGLEYGLALGDGRFAGTPYLTYADGGNGREYVLGWQLAPMRREGSDFMVDLKAVRSESVETRPEHELGFDLRFSW